MLRKLLTLTAAATATASFAFAQDAPSVTIEDVVAEVRIVSGDTLQAEVSNPLADHPIEIESRDGLLNITAPRIRSLRCRNEELTINGDVRVDRDELPVLTIQAPQPLDVRIEDSAVTGALGDVADLELEQSSCLDIQVGNVAGNADIAHSGSGDLAMGDIGGALEFNKSGSGDSTTGRVAGIADIALSGSGDFTLAGSESLDFRGSSSADVEIGETGDSLMRLSGSGDVAISDLSGDLDLATSGSGDLTIATINGDVRVQSSGSGDVTMGEGTIGTLELRKSGSGDFDAPIDVAAAEITATGSGDITLGSVTGRFEQRGNADVTVLSR
jgi:hypothetical protein